MASLIVIIMLFVCIAMPIWFSWRMWRLDEASRAGWLLILADSAVFVLLIMIVGRWDMAGIWTRPTLAALFVAAALLSMRRHTGRPWTDGSSIWRRHIGTIGSLLLFGCALIYVLLGLLMVDRPKAFAFPLDDGTFVIAHGGSNALLNHHSNHPAQQYAVDIGAVNAAGVRTWGLLPTDPARYAAFGKTITSPCDGLVTAAVDGLPDLAPPRADRGHPAGNHVIIDCNGLLVELAHFRRGSVAVTTGTVVRSGQILGQVGNSGNTTEPHLHMHASDARTGLGVAITFDGVVPTRNTLFVR